MAHPTLELRDILALVAGQDVGDVDELGGEVAQDVHVAVRGRERQDLRGAGDEGLGLGVEGVEVFRWGVDGVDAGRHGLQFAAGGRRWSGDLRV